MALPTKIALEVVTPEGLLLREEVDEVIAPGSEGFFGVLPGHTPFFSLLGLGELSYRQGAAWYRLTCFWGFCEVLPDRVNVLAEMGERAADIDVARASGPGPSRRADEDDQGGSRLRGGAHRLRPAVTRLAVARTTREPEPDPPMPAPVPARLEVSVPTETLLRLATAVSRRCPTSRVWPRAATGARGRAAASALGTLIREDPYASGRRPSATASRRPPAPSPAAIRAPAQGRLRARPRREPAVDRSWIVRVGRRPRARRVPGRSARARARVAARRRQPPGAPRGLGGARRLQRGRRRPRPRSTAPTPHPIGSATPRRAPSGWSASPPLTLRSSATSVRSRAGDGGPAGCARFLAGEARVAERDSREAEQLRYAQEKENHYNFTKPFTPGHRDQNIRLLHSFLVVAEHLRVPRGGRVLDLGGGAALGERAAGEARLPPVHPRPGPAAASRGPRPLPPRAPDRALHRRGHDVPAVP
jgi:ATP synthase F1 epsilon subunit